MLDAFKGAMSLGSSLFGKSNALTAESAKTSGARMDAASEFRNKAEDATDADKTNKMAEDYMRARKEGEQKTAKDVIASLKQFLS